MEHATRLSSLPFSRRIARSTALLGGLGLSVIAPSSAHSALSEFRVEFEPSASTHAAGYMMHIGTETGDYASDFDLGNPTASSGTVIYAVDLEDSVDLFVAVSAYDGSGDPSPYSNEVKVTAVAAPPPEPETPPAAPEVPPEAAESS